MYRKNHLAQVTAFCLSMGLVLGNGVTAMADEETVGFAQCNEYLNVRTDADGESEVIGLLRNNGRVEILGEENGWYHIKSGNVEGYVSSEYVVTGEAAEEIAQTAGYTTAEVGAEVLNIRQAASDDSEKVGTAYENQELEVVEDDGDWVKVVTDDGVYGYVSTNYVYTSTAYRLAETIQEYEERTSVPTVVDYDAPSGESTDSAQSGSESSYTEEQSYTEEPAYAEETTYTEPTYTEETTYTEPTYTEETEYTEPTYTEETEYTEPTYTEETEYTEPTYTEETEYTEPTYTEETEYTEPSYTEETEYTEPTYTEETEYTEPTYTEETEYTEPSYTEETEYTEPTNTEDPSSQASTGSSTGQAVADYACQFVGNPYVYGGTSLTNGCDCSGFVMAVYANFGISLPHYSGSQMGYGTAVDASSLAPGDLVFYGAGGSDHVAIYIGSGSVVHAAGESYGIIISSISWAGTPSGYRRLV